MGAGDDPATRQERARCPSSECRPGAVVLGVVLPNGRVAFAAKRVIADEQFVRIAQEGRPPEQRFRFSTPCAEQGCRQWTTGRCGVIDRLLAIAHERGEIVAVPDPLPECSIRSECRWYRQRGGVACAVCPDVVTDQARCDAERPPHVLARRRRGTPRPIP